MPLTRYGEGEEIVTSLWKHKEILIVIHSEKIMKKFDKEYSTQYVKEMKYLLHTGIKYDFVKVINEITTYKYEKTPELFKALELFYAKN